MVQFIRTVSALLMACIANGLTARSKLGSHSMMYRSSQAILNRPKHFIDHRSRRQSSSCLTSTHVDARSISRPFLSLIPRTVTSSIRSLSKTFKRRGPQRLLIGSILAAVIVFGPAFSPAANAAANLVTLSSAPTSGFSTQSRALGTFHFIPTKAELELCFRLLYAACSGAFIGLERSSQDRPAGVRTMALVGLGACIYAVCSTHGFLPASALGYAPGSPMLANVKCDLSRMAANVASGVGFIGAGAIHKSKLHGNGTEAQNVVAGLTTAAAIWVSAAVGVASATGLYFVGGVAAMSTVAILRFAKVTKEDEPGFSWGPRPLEEEDLYCQEKQSIESTRFVPFQGNPSTTLVSHPQEKHTNSRVDIRGSNIDIKYLSDEAIAHGKDRSDLKGLFGYDKMFGQSSMDPRLENYLRKHDKEKGYSCLEQDVRVFESRVLHQNSSMFEH